MGFLSSLLAVFGFGIGIPFGLIISYFIFHYFESDGVKDPEIAPLHELDRVALQNLKPKIPFWVKMPDYDRVDWLNHFILDIMGPHPDKGICATIRTILKPYFEEYVGQYQMQKIGLESLTLGTLPPTVHRFKFYETKEKELVMEPAIRWAGNPNMIVAIKLWSVIIRVQVTLKPVVPAFSCFGNIVLSLMEKPQVDFGLKLMGLDLMSVPLLYRFVQETIRKQVANLHLWPEFLEIPVLDTSTGAAKKPVGILHVKVVRAMKLLKRDLLGTSDPYVKLNLSGERLPSKKTTIKKKNLDPEWNEKFKLAVNDPEDQILHINVFDWD